MLRDQTPLEATWSKDGGEPEYTLPIPALRLPGEAGYHSYIDAILRVSRVTRLLSRDGYKMRLRRAFPVADDEQSVLSFSADKRGVSGDEP